MAVEAPVAGSTSAADLAHMPKIHAPAVPGYDSGHELHVVADHQGRGVGDGMVESEYALDGAATNGKARKRSASPHEANIVGKTPCSAIIYHICEDRVVLIALLVFGH